MPSIAAAAAQAGCARKPQKRPKGRRTVGPREAWLGTVEYSRSAHATAAAACRREVRSGNLPGAPVTPPATRAPRAIFTSVQLSEACPEHASYQLTANSTWVVDGHCSMYGR